jgi:hypothetical protein
MFPIALAAIARVDVTEQQFDTASISNGRTMPCQSERCTGIIAKTKQAMN